VRTIVLDSGAFIAVERRSHVLGALLDEARNRIVTSANVIAEIWRPPPTYGIAMLLRSVNEIVSVTNEDARQIGALLAQSGTSQITDAHVASIAIANEPSLVLTSDPGDIEHLLTTAGATWRRGASTGKSVDVIVAVV